MLSEIPVVVLCGGRWFHLEATGERYPKPLVPVAGEPILVHVLARYLDAGFCRFILADGYQHQVIVDVLTSRYGARLSQTGDAFSVQLRGHSCEIVAVDTGVSTSTGDRVKAVARWLGDAPVFGVTYSDTYAAVDLAAMFRAHQTHGRIATLLAARFPPRQRILGLRPEETLVRGFASKAVIQSNFINGGFYVFNRAILGPEYLGAKDGIVLEETVLDKLASNLELVAFLFEGAYQPIDSERDRLAVERLLGEAAPTPGN